MCLLRVLVLAFPDEDRHPAASELWPVPAPRGGSACSDDSSCGSTFSPAFGVVGLWPRHWNSGAAVSHRRLRQGLPERTDVQPRRVLCRLCVVFAQ